MIRAVRGSLIAVVLFSTPCAAQAQQVSVPTDHGPFDFNVTMRVEGAPIIRGHITNSTDRSWETVQFEVVLFDRQGKPFKNPMGYPWSFEVTDLARGQSKEIGLAGWGDQMSGRVDGRLGKFEIKFATGNYLVSYVVGLEKPKPHDSPSFEDDLVNIVFEFGGTGIGLTLLNKTDSPVTVDWNKVSFVDTGGTAHRVIHQGIRLIQRDQPMVATTVPPRAKISDFVYPSDLVLQVKGEWVTPPLLPIGAASSGLKGKTFSLFLPLEIDGSAKNYNFVFAIRDVKPK